jgi:hypothetical protein
MFFQMEIFPMLVPVIRNFALAACLVSPMTAVAQVSASASHVFAAWSMIIGETDTSGAGQFTAPKVAFRFATDAKSCDGFLVAKPGTDPAGVMAQGVAPVQWPGDLPDILVCTLPLDETWTQAQLFHKADGSAAVLYSKINEGSEFNDQNADLSKLPSGKADGKPVIVAGPASIGQHGDLTMVTLGDTGCKGKDFSSDGNRQYQLCEDVAAPASWPFASLADRASQPDAQGRTPDLVVHVGDYRYFFEKTGPADSWNLWYKDFFPAAQPLLLSAPWVFARGNHEGCIGASDPWGVGYFQFFGTDANTDCSSVPSADPYMKPWFFDVKPAGASNDLAHRFVVLDTNGYNGTDGAGEDKGFQSGPAIRNFQAAIKMSGDATWSSWWVKHTPTVQLIYYTEGGRAHYGDKSFRHALLTATGEGTAVKDRFCGYTSGATCRPSQVLLGHEHLYQDVVFGDATSYFYPRQFIVGHGGVDLDSDGPAYGTTTECLNDNFPIGANRSGVAGTATTRTKHGYVVWTRNKTTHSKEPSGWQTSYVWAGEKGSSPILSAADMEPCPG